MEGGNPTLGKPQGHLQVQAYDCGGLLGVGRFYKVPWCRWWWRWVAREVGLEGFAFHLERVHIYGLKNLCEMNAPIVFLDADVDTKSSIVVMWQILMPLAYHTIYGT